MTLPPCMLALVWFYGKIIMVVIVSDEHSSTPLQKQKLGETTFTNGGGILPPSKDEECQLN